MVVLKLGNIQKHSAAAELCGGENEVRFVGRHEKLLTIRYAIFKTKSLLKDINNIGLIYTKKLDVMLD